MAAGVVISPSPDATTGLTGDLRVAPVNTICLHLCFHRGPVRLDLGLSPHEDRIMKHPPRKPTAGDKTAAGNAGGRRLPEKIGMDQQDILRSGGGDV